MKLFNLLFLPFLLQGACMFFDEFYFHWRRGLDRWERIGHPIDTTSVLAAYLCLLFLAPSMMHLAIYSTICVFSCLLITKDEFVHQAVCTGGEAWLHAVLFVLHPLVFMVAGLIWYFQDSSQVSQTSLWLGLQFQILLTFGFLTYQIGYWNFYAKQK